jgi:hypothetical protein
MTTKRLTYINGEAHWLEIESRPVSKLPDGIKEDLTLDGYIKKYGSIYNHGDGKHYDSKRSYMEALKQKGQHIKDY